MATTVVMTTIEASTDFINPPVIVRSHECLAREVARSGVGDHEVRQPYHVRGPKLGDKHMTITSVQDLAREGIDERQFRLGIRLVF